MREKLLTLIWRHPYLSNIKQANSMNLFYGAMQWSLSTPFVIIAPLLRGRQYFIFAPVYDFLWHIFRLNSWLQQPSFDNLVLQTT